MNSSLKETLLERLKDYDVRDLRVDRDAEEKGTDVIKVTASVDGRPVQITYNKKNGMSAEEMGDVLASYLRRSIRA